MSSRVEIINAAHGVVFLSSDGTTRRQRGAAIAAYARRHNLKRLSDKPRYDETYGFLGRTTIRYQER